MSPSSWTTVCVSLILLLACLAKVRGNGDSFQRVFQTEESVRQNKADQIRRQMNRGANPCNDFYEYACGNWQSETTPLSQLEQRTDVHLLRLLEEAAHRQDSPLVRHAKEFHKSCVTAKVSHSDQQQQFVSEFIQQNGGFPAVPGSNWATYHQNYDWLQVIGRLRKSYGLDILIGLRVGYNYANVHENSIYLSEPTMLIPNELCRRRQDLHNVTYKAIEQLVTEQLRNWLAMSNEASARLAADIVSFEQELCGAMHGMEQWDAELHLYKANFTRKTLDNFKQLYGLDFDTYVTKSFGQTISKPVYMAAPDYYRQLRRTLDAHNHTHVANYIMYRAIAALTFPLEDKPARRPIYCLGRVKQLLPTALGEMYAQQYGSAEVKTQLFQLYGQLQDALKQSLSADWLEEGNRRIAQRKLSDLRLMLPEYEQPLTLRLQLERTNYWHNLRQLLGQMQSQQLKRLYEEGLPSPADPVEAYETRVKYRPLQQRLEVGWARLQPPDYDERYGQAMKYATLGAALAEQMLTAFDELHWSVSLLERNNWDALVAWRYHNRSECFSRHVEEYLQANATATQLLMSSSAGLSAAFHAYLAWLNFQEPNNDFKWLTKETLPGVNYSNTALFFIAYAQQHCRPRENQRDDPNQLPTVTYSVRQSHSWTRLLVNGPLRNLADFAREFHCPAGSPMNPAEKCVIY